MLGLGSRQTTGLTWSPGSSESSITWEGQGEGGGGGEKGEEQGVLLPFVRKVELVLPSRPLPGPVPIPGSLLSPALPLLEMTPSLLQALRWMQKDSHLMEPTQRSERII